MATGVPLLKSIDLFNKLSLIEIEDVGAAKQIADDALALNKSHPGDFTTKVALGQALLLSGRRDAAVDQLQAAFSIREAYQFEYVVMDRLAVLLMFVADRDRALRTVESVAFQPGMFDSGMDGNNHAHIAAWAMDMDLLRRLMERDVNAGVVGNAYAFGNIFASINYVEEFQIHQRILIEVMRTVQVAACFSYTSDASGFGCFLNNIIFDGSKVSRRELEQRVDAAIRHRLGDKLDDVVLNVLTAAPSLPTGTLRAISGGVAASP